MNRTLPLLLVCTFTAGAAVPPDPAQYEAFFNQIVQLAHLRNSPAATPDPQRYTLQSALGLADSEASTLDSVAARCQDAVRAFETGAAPLLFEARLTLIESPTDPKARQQVQSLEDQRRQIILDHVRLLRSQLADLRFNLIEDLITTGKPLPAQVPLPVRK
jgi:hypothetical protein